MGNGNELVSVNVKIAYVIDDLCQYVTAYASPEDVLTAKAYEIILSRTVSTDLDTFLSEDRSGLSEEIAKELNDFCAASGIGLRVGSVTLESIHPPIDIADVYQGVVSAGIQKNTLITNARAEEAEKLAAAEQEAAELVLVAKKDRRSGSPKRNMRSTVFWRRRRRIRSIPTPSRWQNIWTRSRPSFPEIRYTFLSEISTLPII